jgi:hypothetical protein
MTTATRDEEAVGSSGEHPVSKMFQFHERGRWRIDLIGALAVVIAGLGLVGTLVFLRPTPSAMPQTVSVPPARDQWYLDPPAQPTHTEQSTPARDRWYVDNP